MKKNGYWVTLSAIAAIGVIAVGCENPQGSSGSGDDDGSGDKDSENGDITYEVGSEGPAGGLIFYVDDDDFYDDFDYLEAAPADWSGGGDPELTWQVDAENVTNTDQARGSGADNTEEIISQSDDLTPAATAADMLEINGYDDWFLPSQTELEDMKVILHDDGLGAFEDAVYWTSTSQGIVGGSHLVLVEDFDPDGDADEHQRTELVVHLPGVVVFHRRDNGCPKDERH